MPVAATQRLTNGQWQKTFPMQINTETLSLVFVKKLFAVAVSNVAFVRKLFPDNAFFDKNIEGISLKILKEEASCPGTCKVVFWLRGCFDAIERRYLRKATLVLYENPSDPKTIMESFSFTFRYDNKEGASMAMEAESISSAKSASGLPRDERVKVQTKNLLNAILAAGKMLGPLPKKMMLTMKLQYYDSAPSDYMPNGFKLDENPEMIFQRDPVNLKIGLVDTSKAKSQPSHAITIKSSNICHTPRSTYQPTQPETDEQAEEEFEVACPCGVNLDDGVMILCDGCEKWQHAVCFRIIDDADIPQSHLCNACAKAKPQMLESGSKTDPTLAGLTVEEAKSVCLLRRAILLCVENDVLSVGVIAKRLSVEVNIAKGLLNKLLDEGALKDVRGRSGNKAVLKAHVEAVLIPRFFSPASISPELQTGDLSRLENGAIPTKGKRGKPADIDGLASAAEELQISNNMRILSQESTDSPTPCKRRRSYNTMGFLIDGPRM
ncbi:HORMA domain-containing protein 2 [Taenia solium]|eukprot:TsM_000797100 transcript=TsM_000797100 gene=TsM_000797100